MKQAIDFQCQGERSYLERDKITENESKRKTKTNADVGL